MTHAHFVKKARKDYPDFGIQKGDSYWWWEFAFGSSYKSKAQPKPSQLTRSEFLSTYLSIGETLDTVLQAAACSDDIQSAIDEAKDSIEELKSYTEDKLSNMPEQLQEADSGQLMQERIDQLDDWLSSLDSVDLSPLEDAVDSAQNDDSGSAEEKISEALQDVKDRVSETDPGIDNWSSGREVEDDSLENYCVERHRRFESFLLRMGL